MYNLGKYPWGVGEIVFHNHLYVCVHVYTVSLLHRRKPDGISIRASDVDDRDVWNPTATEDDEPAL